jgi:two-component system, NtrC family, sensor histidine kinase PilS
MAGTLSSTSSLTSTQKVIIEMSRVAFYILILAIGLISFLFQPRFINWTVLAPVYAGVGLSLSFHLFYISILERFYERPRWLFFSFLADSAFISILIYSSGQNQSLFLFLHLANIILSGLLFQSRGALLVALFTSLSFTLVSLLSVELKGLNYIFLLVINNISFFLVAGLSGFLSDQLHAVGQRLEATGIQLRSLSEINDAIVNSSPLGIMIFDTRGNILHRNPEMVKIFGFQSDAFKILGPIQKHLGPAGCRVEAEFTEPRGGDKKLLQVFIRPLKNTEGTYLALVEDQTEVKELESRLQQNEKLAAIGGLAAGIAHEIRNPLAGISGSIQLLSQAAANSDDKKLMEIILREIDRLNNLISEFLDFAKTEKAPTETVNLKKILDEVMHVVSKNKNLPGKIQHHIKIDDGLLVKGYDDKLKQAFLNVVINAYQAMSEASSPVLSVEALHQNSFAVVRISDTGMGMSDEVKRRIFEPFFTTKSKGTGLGLAMTHKILQVHGAEINVESEKGRGTTFEIKFPLVRM